MSHLFFSRIISLSVRLKWRFIMAKIVGLALAVIALLVIAIVAILAG